MSIRFVGPHQIVERVHLKQGRLGMFGYTLTKALKKAITKAPTKALTNALTKALTSCLSCLELSE